MTETIAKNKTNTLIEMVSAMARLDFSQRIKTNFSNEPIDVLAHGLNMLSEELEYKISEKNRLEEINENLERFSLTVAHDLKSPVFASNGLINFMLEEIKEEGHIPEKTLTEYLNVLKDANTQISKLINGILQYSRLENDRMDISTVSLGDLCWKVRQGYKSKENVTFQYSEDLPTVKHNETALRQVFTNLISNAIKYNDKEHCEIYITSRETENYYQISVRDNGPGLKDEEKNIIFNLFENLRNASYESTGVGLAIVEKIVTKAGGKIWVEDAQPSGANFTFTIPKK